MCVNLSSMPVRTSRASSSPFALAMLSHMCASTWSFRTPPAIDVHRAEEQLREVVALLGGQSEPTRSLDVIFADTAPLRIRESEGNLPIRVALVGG